MAYLGNVKKNLNGIKLSDIISRFIPLEKKNDILYFARCPFHQEKTPSFFINNVKNLYYCFGCKKHGNVITFVMCYKKISYHEAVNLIITDFNFETDALNERTVKTKFNYHNILEKISTIYYSCLIKTNDAYALKFLRDRNISNEALHHFKLGYALGNTVINLLIKEMGSIVKYKLLDLKFIRYHRGIAYDKFDGRLIFSIRNDKGNTVGFAGRVLRGDAKNKYINSAASEIFVKKNILYGLHEALSVCKNVFGIVVVEGYLDVISLYIHGISNVVSTMGTSFSMEQFVLLKKYYNKIIICYDGDEAGKNASFTIAKKLLEFLGEDIYIGFIILPNGYDPDTIINSEKKDLFIDMLNKPIYILDFIIYYFLYIDQNQFYDNPMTLYMACNNLVNSNISDLDLKRIVLKFFEQKIFCKKRQIIHRVKDGVKLSLCGKAIIYLLKDRRLIKNLDIKTIFAIKMSNKIDSNLLFNFASSLKDNIDVIIEPEMLPKSDLHIDIMALLNEMPYDILVKEFNYMIKKIIT